ncbi:MAG: CoA pyrophosphatase [Pseudomonadota bacterium]
MAINPTLEEVRAALNAPAGPSSDFDLNEVSLPPGRKLRAAAVLMLLVPGARGLEVVLTKRSSALKHHPGQISFPGGKQEEGDADAWACATREAAEEIGANPAGIEPLGTLPTHETVTSFTIAPQVGLLTTPQDFYPSDGEVAEVFQVPLAHVADPASYVIEGRMWQGAIRRYYAVPYGPYYIWGATARMLRGFAERVSA